MIKSMNQPIEFDQDLEQLYKELESRPELACTGEACGAKGSLCGLNF